MSGVSSCDRFEREGALKVERGERLGLHYSLCPRCKAAYAQYQRLIAALSFMDEPEERDAFAEDRLLARINGRSSRRWPKIVPLSAFFGFLSLGRRAAAAQKSTAVYAVTALSLIGPLPIVMAGNQGAAYDQTVMVATGVERPSIEVPQTHHLTPEMAVHREGLAKSAASDAGRTAELRRMPKLARSPRNKSTAVVSQNAPSSRGEAERYKNAERRCAEAQCPNVVLEMVVNGLTNYDRHARQRREEIR